MSEGYFGTRTKGDVAELLAALVTAHHILHQQGVLDAFGHVSVRNPDNPTGSFWLPHNCPPALLASAGEDLVEYRIEDAACVDGADEEGRRHFVERYIHSELYKRFPDVNAVVHSHCREVLPYCVGSVTLRPMTHMTGFLGAAAPVWDITPALSSSAPHDFLVRSAELGQHLSAAFAPPSSMSFIYNKMRSALPSALTGGGGGGGSSQGASTSTSTALSSSSSSSAAAPAHPVVLMRNHGFTAAADSLERAVFQAVYTRDAAAVESAALQNQAAWGVVRAGVAVEGSVEGEAKGGKIKGGKVGGDGYGQLRFLKEKEAADCWETMGKHVERAWRLWCREVEVAPLYQNSKAAVGRG